MWCSRVLILLATGACISAGAPASELPKGVHAGIGFENGGHESVGPYKLKSFMRFDDQFGAGESIGLATTHAGLFDELRGVVVTYEQPFLTHWRATLAAGWSVAEPGGLIGKFFDETTTDRSLAGTLSYTLRPSPNLVTVFGAGLSSSDGETERIAKDPASGLADARFDQRTRDLLASLAFKYTFSQNTGLVGSLSLAQGLDWDAAHIRVNADDTASIVRASAAFTHNLPLSWQVVLSASGQWTPSRVTDTRLFSIGGWDHAVAYPPAERFGDIGAAARAELNHLGAMDLPYTLGKLYYKPFVFVDGAFTQFNDPVAGEVSGVQTEASAGYGLGILTTGGFHAGIQVSHQLSGASIFGDDDVRVLFSVGLRK